MNAWRADPLVWGHAPRVFEVFLEPTCPLSVKAFGKVENLREQAGGRLQQTARRGSKISICRVVPAGTGA